MGKIVKYCSSCDEGFAERFTFCPTCGASLQAFEMNPVQSEEVVTQDISERVEAAPTTQPLSAETVEVSEPMVVEPVSFKAAPVEDEVAIIEPVEVEDDVPATVAIPAAENVFVHEAMDADEPRSAFFTPQYERGGDDGYYITVIEEKNVKQRNMLLLGSTVFCITVALAATVYSLFDKALDVGAIDDGRIFSAVIVDDPMATEPEQEEKKDKDDSGGGGGGGKEQPDPVNKGDLPDQSRNPIRPPDPNTFRSDNFELKTPVPTTEGTRKFEKNYGVWGDPNSQFGKLSSGPGTGGGMGTGIGTGVGSGRGTGTGSGSGSGYGSGDGDGDGDGSGSGRRGGPPPKAAAVTTALKILSKPKATYTDAARTNNVQGSVRLKITLLASGQVGSIVPVTRLPHGLTEQAIAAARQIRFEPKRVNGVAQSVVVTFDYGFNIY